MNPINLKSTPPISNFTIMQISTGDTIRKFSFERKKDKEIKSSTRKREKLTSLDINLLSYVPKVLNFTSDNTKNNDMKNDLINLKRKWSHNSSGYETDSIKLKLKANIPFLNKNEENKEEFGFEVNDNLFSSQKKIKIDNNFNNNIGLSTEIKNLLYLDQYFDDKFLEDYKCIKILKQNENWSKIAISDKKTKETYILEIFNCFNRNLDFFKKNHYNNEIYLKIIKSWKTKDNIIYNIWENYTYDLLELIKSSFIFKEIDLLAIIDIFCDCFLKNNYFPNYEQIVLDKNNCFKLMNSEKFIDMEEITEKMKRISIDNEVCLLGCLIFELITRTKYKEEYLIKLNEFTNYTKQFKDLIINMIKGKIKNINEVSQYRQNYY